MGRVRSRFLRACVEIIHQETAGAALSRLREGLPPQLRGVLRDVLSTRESDASVDLGPGLELLLGIDGVLCGGSGVVTTRIAASLASRVLSQSAGLVTVGDAVTTLQHLRAPFEHPFLDVAVHYHARRSPDGFTLELNMPHEQRAARWLTSAGLGYAKAATQFSGEGAVRLRLYAEVTGGLARILGRHNDSGVVAVVPTPAGATAGASSTRPARRRSGPTNAAERVDQILSRAPGRATPSSGLTPRGLIPTRGMSLGTFAPGTLPPSGGRALPHGARPNAISERAAPTGSVPARKWVRS